MKKQSFIIGALILTIGGFIAKVIGAFYKIPLTNILGSGGMGVYYLIFPIYSLLFILSSGGLSIALSKCVASERIKKNKKNETTYFKSAILISFIISLFFCLCLIAFSKNISYAQGNINAYIGYIALAPALICSSLVSIIKGYFQGIENMIPSSISMILEQIVKLTLGLVLATKLLPLGIQFGVLGALLGVTLSELITLVIMFINYAWYKWKDDYKFFIVNNKKEKIIQSDFKKSLSTNKVLRKSNNYKRKSYKKKLMILYFYKDNQYLSFKDSLKNLIKLALPMSLTSIIIPLTSFIDSFMVINLLTKGGLSFYTSVSLYGISNGVVSSLISLPVIVTVALSTAIVPSLSGLVVKNNPQEINARASFFVKVTFLIALPMFLCFFILSQDVIGFLYNSGLSDRVFNEFDFANKLLFVSSISIIYSCLLSTFVSILNAINKPIIPFWALFIGLILRTLLCYVLLQIKSVNIFGVVISNIIFLSFVCVILVVYMKKYINFNFYIVDNFIKPILSIFAGGIVMFALRELLHNHISKWAYIGICGVSGVGVYLMLIIWLKCLDRQELSYFPNRKIFKKLK